MESNEIMPGEVFEVDGISYRAIKSPYGVCRIGETKCVGVENNILCKKMPVCVASDFETCVIYLLNDGITTEK